MPNVKEALERIRDATTNLDLSSLGLKEVPPEVFRLSRLQYLFLQDNQLREIPSEIGELAELLGLASLLKWESSQGFAFFSSITTSCLKFTVC